MKRRTFLFAAPAAFVAGCGFQLRRVGDMPFGSLYIDAPGGSVVAQRIGNSLARSGRVRLAPSPREAELVLKLGPEVRHKTILSLSGAGRVTEYRLALALTYSAHGREGQVWAVPETIELNRDMTYDDAQILAKDAEEQLLYRDMEENAALRILRRLQSVSPDDAR